MKYKNLLKSKKFKIAVWGTGYIGLSTMVYFAKKRVKCVGYDVNKEKVNKDVKVKPTASKNVEKNKKSASTKTETKAITKTTAKKKKTTTKK